MIADWLPAETRSRIMRSIRAKNTKPEHIVRKSLFADGYRYRLRSAKLPGKPDVVFPSRKKVLFIHGCFWHQHPSPRCSVTGVPASPANPDGFPMTAEISHPGEVPNLA